jgi:hypothetical protein
MVEDVDGWTDLRLKVQPASTMLMVALMCLVKTILCVVVWMIVLRYGKNDRGPANKRVFDFHR